MRYLQHGMALAARLFFRQVDTMQKQIFEYKKFKKSEKFIKNAYHKRFLKSSSFHFLKIIKFIFSRPCFFRFATFFLSQNLSMNDQKNIFFKKKQLNAYYIQFLKCSSSFFFQKTFLLVLENLCSHRPKLPKKKTSCLTSDQPLIFMSITN